MASNRKNLMEATDTVQRLLDAYQLTVDQLAAQLAGTATLDLTVKTQVDTIRPVLDRIAETHEVDLDVVIAQLEDPIGETVGELVDLADQLLTGETRISWRSKLKFFADGWTILPEHLPDAIAAAEAAELRIDLSPDPADHPTVEIVNQHGNTHTYLQLWPGYGDLPIDRVRRAKIEIAGKFKRADTLTRAAWRDRARAEKGLPSLGWTGDGAVAQLYAAVSYLYGLARGEGHIDATFDPLADVTVPDRGETDRGPLSKPEVDSLWATVALYSSDPELDRLLTKFFFHTGARRDGAINLTLGRLDWERQSVKLLQKYGKTTEVPVCRTLLEELYELAVKRGSTDADDPVFRVNIVDDGQHIPLSDKHFDTLHRKVQTNLDWAGEKGWTVHWLRHHAKAEIHDIGGPAVARKFMGHAPGHVSEKYGPASFENVAWAISIRTGEPHPLAKKPHWLK